MPDRNPLCELYERLYFHEIDTREHLNARIQIPLAITISLVGVLAFMVQNSEQELCGIAAFLFLFFLLFSTATLICAIYFLIRSWFGNTYSFLPAAAETEEYRNTLIKTYENINNGKEIAEQHLHDYLCNYFIQCSTKNTNCNDKRSIYLHKTNACLILTVFLAATAFLFFFFGGMDKRQKDTPLNVNIIHPLEIKESVVNKENDKDTPPSPPPPPPPRLIREGVEVINPAGDNNGKR